MLNIELRISNDSSKVFVFCLEPWGGKYKVSCQKFLRVVIESPSSPVLEWEVAEDVHTLIVHDPAGALATVYDGEHQVLAE